MGYWILIPVYFLLNFGPVDLGDTKKIKDEFDEKNAESVDGISIFIEGSSQSQVTYFSLLKRGSNALW